MGMNHTKSCEWCLCVRMLIGLLGFVLFDPLGIPSVNSAGFNLDINVDTYMPVTIV